MSVSISQFGKTNIGKDIKLYTIKNSKGMEAAVTNLGACLVNLVVANDKGEFKDIILGFDSGEEYLVNGSFFGHQELQKAHLYKAHALLQASALLRRKEFPSPWKGTGNPVPHPQEIPPWP